MRFNFVMAALLFLLMFALTQVPWYGDKPKPKAPIALECNAIGGAIVNGCRAVPASAAR